MKNKFPFLVLICLTLCFSDSLKAQKTTFFEGDFKPLVIWVYPQEQQKEVYAKMAALKDSQHKKYYFLLVCDSLSSKTVVSKKINNFLNSEASIDKQRVYYLEWGDKPKSSYFENAYNDIIADFYYYQIDVGTTNFKLDDTINQFEGKYIWDITLSEIESKSLKTNPQVRKLSLGLIWGRASQDTFKEDSAYLPSSINTFGLTASYRINPKLYIVGRGQFSINLPNTSNLQSTLFSQIDISKGGKQTVAIDMKAHVLLQGSVQANYYLSTKKKFNPFIGVGFSYINFRSAKIHKETQIDISNFRPGSGTPGGLGDVGADLPFFKGSVVKPIVSVGASYKLMKNLNLIASVDYTYNNKKELNGIDIKGSSKEKFSMNFGLQFMFNKGQKKYYQYIREL